MEHIQPYLDYFSANPEWAIALIFLIAFGEALLIIGLFVPSTAVLVGAGVLVGTGQLGFWPVFLATAIGAIAGDQVSYWAGRLFGDRLKSMWPLNRYPALVARGEDFVRQHGGKSIAIGRFVPGVKAVVPGIIGMLGMSQLYFIFVNFTSGLVWTAAHVFPGMLLGQGLALAGELSGRLAVVLLMLLVLLGVLGWVLRLLAAGVSPYLNAVLASASGWARASRSRALNRFGRAIMPGNPRATLIVLFLAILIVGALALIDLVSGLVVRDALSNLDISVANLVSQWRNAPADELMIPLAMLGDRPVVWAVGLSIGLWLTFHRAWRAALVLLILLLAGEAIAKGLSQFVARPAPAAGGIFSDSFPSAHVLMAGLMFGLMSVLASHAMGRWSKAVVTTLSGLIVIAIAFARVYLGANWLSDVMGGMLCALILTALFGVVIEAIPSRRIRPIGLIGFALIAFIIAGSSHVSNHFDEVEMAVSIPAGSVVLSERELADEAMRKLPSRRIDLAGQSEEIFAVHWVGPIARLEQTLILQGWNMQPKWTWRDSISYLDAKAALAALPPRPLLHEGLKAKLTAIKVADGQTNERLVVRAYKTNARIDSVGVAVPIYSISVKREISRSRFNLYAIPASYKATEAEVSSLVAALEHGEGVSVLAASSKTTEPRAILLAKP